MAISRHFAVSSLAFGRAGRGGRRRAELPVRGFLEYARRLFVALLAGDLGEIAVLDVRHALAGERRFQVLMVIDSLLSCFAPCWVSGAWP